MPPRKRAKASAASTPLTEAQPKTPQETGTAAQSQGPRSPSQNENLINDPWTDDQETQLFKSMIKWKPTGLHKHFRMISIHNNMRSHGFVTENTPHTRIPGIWRKLDQLYDLQALDEREVAWEFREEPDPNDPDEAYDCADFELPEEDFGELMWQKRFHSTNSEVSSSPPVIPMEEDKALYHPGAGLLSGLPEGAKSQKAESVSGATPTPKIAKPGTRSGRAAARGGRNTKGGQAAKNSKAQSAVSESADEEDEDDDEEEDSVESEEETAPTTRKTNRSSGRTRPPTRRTRKR